MRILAIDYGTKRIGLAVSDESQTIARELEILPPNIFWQQLEALIFEQEIEKIIVGLPLNMSGEDTDKTAEAKKFAEELKTKILVPVEMVDERLSSQMAEQIAGHGINIDSLAAQIFLQNYLNSKKQ